MTFPKLVFRVQRKMERSEMQDYTNSFITLVDTDNEADFYKYYRFVDLNQKNVEGFSVFKNGIMPLLEDERTRGCVRIRVRSLPADVCVCFDYLLRQLIDGFLATEHTFGIEYKIKGDFIIYYIWTLKEKADEIASQLTSMTEDIKLDIQEVFV